MSEEKKLEEMDDMSGSVIMEGFEENEMSLEELEETAGGKKKWGNDVRTSKKSEANWNKYFFEQKHTVMYKGPGSGSGIRCYVKAFHYKNGYFDSFKLQPERGGRVFSAAACNVVIDVA